jgi:chromosome segregation ATPase
MDCVKAIWTKAATGMSTTLDAARGCDETANAGKLASLRLDPPHDADATRAAGDTPSLDQSSELLELEQPTDALVAAVLGDNVAAEREQLQLQVSQLAAHLRDRLRELDRREAAVNARASQLEADLRASRIWLQERELAFQERERELQDRIAELEELSVPQVVSLPEQKYDQQAYEDELRQREQQLQVHEDDVRERRFEVDRQAAALSHAQQLWQQQREREERLLAADREQMTRELNAAAAEREEQLRTAEALLREHLEKLAEDERVISTERAAWERERKDKLQAIDELRIATEAECADLRVRLDARQEWLERQKAGLEQVRNEALRLHRQSLEMRLLAEQLWAQISGSLSPAEVTHAIAQLRLKLAEQYKIEEQQLAERRDELLHVSERITERYSQLEQLRSGLREWANTRQEEIERQAAALVERELGLDAQQDEFRRAERQWQADRRGYEQQIRDLTTQLRTLPTAA